MWLSVLVITMPTKGKLLLTAVSIFNWIAGCASFRTERKLFIIREVNSDMPIYKQNKCWKKSNATKLIFDSLRCGCLGSSVVRAPFMRSGCRGFESRSGHLIFSSICSVYR